MTCSQFFPADSDAPNDLVHSQASLAEPLVEVKYFLELDHFLVRPIAFERFKIRHHSFLPAAVDLFVCHVLQRCLEAFRSLKVAKKQPVRTNEEGVIMPSGTSQRLQHFGPDCLVSLLVLFQPFLSHFQQEPYSFHKVSGTSSSRMPRIRFASP